VNDGGIKATERKTTVSRARGKTVRTSEMKLKQK